MGLKNLLFKPRNTNLLLLLVLLLFLPSSSKVVSAQVTTLSVQPNPAYVYLNGSNTVTLDLYVTGAVNLQSCDIYIAYDPEILQLTSWAHGNLLVQPIMVLGGDVNEVPGYFYITLIKMGPPPGNGQGTLLRLTFTGTGFGESPVTITQAVFSNPQGVKTYPVLQSGTLITTYDPSIVINSSLSGEVSLQGRSARGGIPVGLQKGLYVYQGPYLTTSLEQPGTNMFFNSVAMDAYPITTAFPYYLNLDMSTNKVKGLVGTSNSFSPLLLLGGNVVNTDNEVNTGDLDLIKMWFGTTAGDLKPGDPLLGDANGDGIVDVRDLALAGGNFGLNGGTAYQGWLP